MREFRKSSNINLAKRAAVFYPVPIYFDGEQYTSDSITFKSILNWGSQFKSLDLVTYIRPHRSEKVGFAIDVKDVRIIGLPSAEGRIQIYFTKAPLILLNLLNIIRAERNSWDMVVLFDSGFPNWMAYFICKLHKIPVALRMVGRYDLFVWESLKYEGFIKKTLALVYSKFIAWFQSRVAREKRIVTDGDDSFVPLHIRKHIQFCVETHLSVGNIPAENPYGNRKKGKILRVLSVSRLHPAKGLHVLIDAISLLHKKNLPLHLDIVGPTYGWKYGHYEYRIKEQIGNNGLDNVKIHGWQKEGDDIKRLWMTSDLFVVPYSSNADGVPRVIFEAMSKGLPIIATRVGGIARVIEDGYTGLLVPPENANILARAIEKVYQDEQTRMRLSQNGFAAVKKYTSEFISKELAEMLVKAAG